MNIVVALEQRYTRSRDGAVWTEAAHSYSHWKRYLPVFDRVHVLARVERVDDAPAHGVRVDGDRVDVIDLPYFVGPRQFVMRAPSLWKAVSTAAADHRSDAWILRMPGTIAGFAARALRRRGNHPFALEVVGDPIDLYSRGATDHAAAPLFKWVYTSEMRRMCREAAARLYVTESTLQARYPGPQGPDGMTDFAASNVELPESAFLASQREPAVGAPLRLISVGMMEQPYKGQDLLIRAMTLLAGRGLDVKLTLIGDGRMRPTLESLASECHVADRVQFHGRVPAGPSVWQALDQSDLFVLASRQEGMPRALLEAMARGLPCVASSVGGVHEVLEPDSLAKPGDITSLADRIAYYARSPEARMRSSARNLRCVRRFEQSILQARREAFYSTVRDATTQWAARA